MFSIKTLEDIIYDPDEKFNPIVVERLSNYIDKHQDNIKTEQLVKDLVKAYSTAVDAQKKAEELIPHR